MDSSSVYLIETLDIRPHLAYNLASISHIIRLLSSDSPSSRRIPVATKIEAINAFRPKLTLNPTAKLDQLVDFIAMRTGANKGTVQLVLAELHDAIAFFNLQGTPVKIEGLGTYTPSIDLDGKLDSAHRADADLIKALNAGGAYKGSIANRENIGKTADDLAALWNAAHPDNLVA